MTGISAPGGVAALVGILMGAPAIGQTPPAATKKAPASSEIVCEKQEVIGSRLQTKRVCMTRGEWADVLKQDREQLERKQTERGL